MAQGRHFRVDQLIFVGGWHASRVEGNSGSVGGLDHVGTELHRLLDSLRRNNSGVCANLSNCVQVVIQVVRLTSNSIYRSSASLVLCPWALGLPVGSHYCH